MIPFKTYILNIGSGYPSDPTTKKFLTNYTYDEMPDFVRRSWATVAKMK
jgi:ribonuclease HII